MEIPPPTENNYGLAWPEGTDQVTKELAGFRMPGKHGFGTRYEHGLRLIQTLWPFNPADNTGVCLWKDVTHYKTGEPVRIYNTYFLRAFHALCERQRVNLTGSASSGKTFSIAVYSLLSFMADPVNTLVMISTTAATDSERRVWGDVKDLWRSAQDRYPIGTLLDYLKTITFDPARELEGKRDVDQRDLGSGICVIAIPKGSEGEKAQGKIIGTKVKHGRLIWVIEEMPHMMDDVLRPEANLESNPDYQLVVTGNANRKSDPHGRASEPSGGWDSIDESYDDWWAGDMFVCFLHGGRGPNDHEAIDPGLTDKKDYPFPYLSNRAFTRNVAYRNGYGSTAEERIANGMQTIDYMRFAVGFWYSDDIEPTVLSRKYVEEHGANSEEFSWGYRPTKVVAGFDAGFSAGGDKNSLMFFEFGNDIHGQEILACDPETVNVSSKAAVRESFRKDIAAQVVDHCVKRGCEPEDFFMDISGDGGLMAIEINSVWSERLGRQARINGVSSLEKTEDDDERYHDVVTSLWFRVQRVVASGKVRGFRHNSGYAKDLYARRYESVGRGKVKIEPKGNTKTSEGRGFKQRLGRSPDDGDAFVYGLFGCTRRGFTIEKAGARRDREADRTKRRIMARLGGSQAPEGSFAQHAESSGWEQVGFS